MNFLIIQYLFTTGEKYNTFLLQVASQEGIQHTYFLLQLTNYVVLFQSGRGAYGNKRRKNIKNIPYWLPLKSKPRGGGVYTHTHTPACLSNKFLIHIHIL